MKGRNNSAFTIKLKGLEWLWEEIAEGHTEGIADHLTE